MTEKYVNNVETTLDGSINNSTTSVVVTDASDFPASGSFRILVVAEGANTDEIMTVTSVSSNTFTVVRASETTAGVSSASSHASGATVVQVLTSGGLLALPTGFALDVPPVTPSSYDDEFNGTTLGAGWTDPLTSASGQDNTTTVNAGAMWFEPATTGTSSTGKRVFGIRKNSPSGSFTAWAKIHVASALESDIRAGIFVADSGGKAHVAGPFAQDNNAGMIGVSTYSESSDWSGYDGFLSGTSFTYGFYHPAWARLRWDSGSSTLYFDFSGDGVTWRNITSRGSLSQPDRMGICIYSNSGAIYANSVMGCSWFRCIDGSAAYTTGNST